MSLCCRFVGELGIIVESTVLQTPCRQAIHRIFFDTDSPLQNAFRLGQIHSNKGPLLYRPLKDGEGNGL